MVSENPAIRSASQPSTGRPETETTCIPGVIPASAAADQAFFTRILFPLRHQNIPGPDWGFSFAKGYGSDRSFGYTAACPSFSLAVRRTSTA